MRFLLPLTGAVLLGICGAALLMDAPLVALPASAQEKAAVPVAVNAPAPPAEAPVVAPAPITIAPHRAVYAMRLLSARNGSDVTGVDGRMQFEWNDVCDGWTTTQATQLVFSYSDGDTEHVDSTQSTWEAKDGGAFRFNYRRASDGKETELYRGKATMTADGGEAVYSEPADKRVMLEKGTLFPSAHTVEILGRAAVGEAFFSRRVFDGTDEAGMSDVSAFSSLRPTAPLAEPPRVRGKKTFATAKDSPLLQGAARAVRLAYFPPGDASSGTPDYEMDMDLLPNGVAKSMQVDYGDFAVIAILEDVKALPAPQCK